MKLFSNSSCDGHEWLRTPTEIRYLVTTYMKMKNMWDILKGFYKILFSLLPRFTVFTHFYVLTFFFEVILSATNVDRTRDVLLLLFFSFIPGLGGSISPEQCKNLSLKRIENALVCACGRWAILMVSRERMLHPWKRVNKNALVWMVPKLY